MLKIIIWYLSFIEQYFILSAIEKEKMGQLFIPWLPKNCRNDQVNEGGALNEDNSGTSEQITGFRISKIALPENCNSKTNELKR